METCIGKRYPGGKIRLGNFLSGMETRTITTAAVLLASLGNFLSGMETEGAGVLWNGGDIPWKLP